MNVYKGCAVTKNINVTSLYSAFEADIKDGYSSVGEAHDFWELVFVKSGKAGVLAGDRILELGENMLILHPPMEFHRIWANSG
ncbi:MAG: AraC family transcriptional regulator, partial [Clostridiales bacterium]|nr:AraC family transcriptional regulator [Clostridiales bacterium]